MQIRHCVEEENVDENMIVKDPTKIRHVVIFGGKIKSMSGYVDPASHLNTNYHLHKVSKCIIAKKFEIGSDILFGINGFRFASVVSSHFDNYGYPDYTKNLSEMIEKVNNLMKSKSINKAKSKKNTLENIRDKNASY
ncbi:MAG: hypothetical protein MRJ93_12705 [Nitrososphaeraceae archaeon]|nr:hypothetical protein [Nitrososphaeraceae archaeon]